MIYIIGGPGKTGSSTVAKRLANYLNCAWYYAGGYMRREAVKLSLIYDNYKPTNINDDKIDWDKIDLDKANLPKFRDYCTTNNRNIDLEMELYLLEGMMQSIQKNINVVIESKTMSRLLHTTAIEKLIKQANAKFSHFKPITLDLIISNSKSIWLHANADTRASRSLYKKYLMKHGKENKYIIFTKKELQQEIDQLKIRQIKDSNDYNLNYQISDNPLLDPPTKLYGHIIDSSEQSPDDTFKKVLEYFEIN